MSRLLEPTPSLSSLISHDYIAVSQEETVGNTIEFLKNKVVDFQAKFAYVYVLDPKGKLAGVLQTRDLLMAKTDCHITSIMKEHIVCVEENAPFKEVVGLFRKHGFFAMPVVDKHQVLKGIISIDQIKKVSKEGFNRLSTNVESEEIEGNSILEIVSKRLPWILISVTSGLMCSYILGIFVGKIDSIIALILFVPIILGSAGNVGTQLARFTIRGLEAAQLSVGKLMRILGKEMMIGAVIGFFSFLIAAMIAFFWKRSPVEGIALGISIPAVSVSSGILGIVLPVAFRVFRLHSNFASRLFLLLICDTLALVIYFAISLSFVSPMLEIT